MKQSKGRIIPAISSVKDFEWFIKSPHPGCIFMNMHLSLLADLVKEAHRNKKRVWIHLDLVHGLASDEYGCEFACQKIGVDGVISTKAKVIETARKNKKTAILRLFLIDSKSLEKGIRLCNTLVPDYVELLPGIAYQAFPEIKAQISAPVMGGGLLRTVEQIEACFRSGVCAVTISDIKLIQAYQEA